MAIPMEYVKRCVIAANEVKDLRERERERERKKNKLYSNTECLVVSYH